MRVAWCFPGQGSQHVGMGKALFDASAAAREVFARADAALGEPISKLCFEGPESELVLTHNTQPALLTVSFAAVAALREQAPHLPLPACAAGHSLGEYSALTAAGALSLEDAVRIVRLRGQAMQSAVPPGQGAMAAIMGLTPADVQSVCEEAAQGEVVSPANFNAPGQIVIAGHVQAVARANQLASSRGGKAIPLKVSAPFHCSLMASATRALAKHLEPIEVLSPKFDVFANVDARPHRDPAEIKALLVRQVEHSVLWEETVANMASAEVTHILELGPGKVIAGLVKRIRPAIKTLAVGDPAGVAAAAELVASSAAATS